MNDFKCTHSGCDQTFLTKNRRQEHQRKEHQSVIKSISRDGVSVELQRREDGGFLCVCGFRNSTPRVIIRHIKAYDKVHTAEREEGPVSVVADKDVNLQPVGETSLNRTVNKQNFNESRLEGSSVDKDIFDKPSPEISADKASLDEPSPGITSLAESHAESSYTGLGWGLLYLEDHEVVLCVECQTGLEPRGIITHLKGHGIKGGGVDEYVESLVLMNPQEVILPEPGIEAIPNLECMDGFQCNFCTYAVCSKKRMRDHVLSSHPAPGLFGYKKCVVQSFFKSIGRKYFQVKSKPEEVPSGVAGMLTPEAFAQEEAKFREIMKRGESRLEDGGIFSTDLSAWMRRTGWALHLKGVNLKSASEMAVLPPKAGLGQLLAVTEAIDRIFDACESAFKTCGKFTQRLMHSPNLDISQQPFTLVTQDTSERYKSVLKRIVVYLTRRAMGETEGFLPELSARQTQCAVDVVEGMKRQVNLDKLVKKLLLSVIAEDDGEDDKAVSALMHCISILSIDRNGTFRPPSGVSPFLAATLYWARLIVLKHALETRGAKETKFGRFKELHGKLLVDCTPSPIGELLSLLAFAKGIGKDDGSLPSVMWGMEGGHSFICGGKEVHMEKMREMFAGQMEAASNALLEFGYNTADITDIMLREVNDHQNVTKPGYCLGGDVTGGLKLIFDNPVLAKMLVRVVDGNIVWLEGGIQQFHRIANRFLDSFLLVTHFIGGQPGRGPEICQLRWGNTHRGMRNFFQIGMNLLFVTSYHKGLSMVGHSKWISRYLPKCATRAYFTYVKMILPIRQFLWNRASATSPDKLLSNFLFTSDGHTPWSPTRLSALIKRETLDYLKVELGIRLYRHVAIAIGRRYFKKGEGFDLESDEGYEDEIDLQAGHSSAVADRIYAVSADILLGLSQHSMEKFSSISRRWHSLMLGSTISTSPRDTTTREDGGRLGHGGEPGNSSGGGSGENDGGENLGGENNGENDNSGENSIGGENNNCGENDNGGENDGVGEYEHSGKLPQDRKRKAPTELPQVRKRVPPYVAYSTMEQYTGTEDDSMSCREDTSENSRDEGPDKECYKILHRIHGASSTFKSQGQFQALSAVCGKIDPIVVILPTAGGKSLVFFGPATMEGAAVTVVIVPFIALGENMVRAAKKMKIRACYWKGKEPLNIDILFVSVESATTDRFRQYIQFLNKTGQLDRVVFDEAHLIVLGSAFRESFFEMDWFKTLNVQRIYLTATLPKYMEGMLEESAMIQGAKIIRETGTRANLCYNVICTKNYIMEGINKAKNYTLLGSEKLIIYTKYRDQCDQIAERLGCSRYYSDWAEKEQNLEEWIAGKSKIIVATTALGAGVDLPGVKAIIHIGLPFGLVDYQQETGRAGRDGVRADCFLFHSPAELKRKSKEDNIIDETAMVTFAETKSCIRWKLGEYFDGEGNGSVCISLKEELCGFCRDDSEAASAQTHNKSLSESAPTTMTGKWTASNSIVHCASSLIGPSSEEGIPTGMDDSPVVFSSSPALPVVSLLKSKQPMNRPGGRLIHSTTTRRAGSCSSGILEGSSPEFSKAQEARRSQWNNWVSFRSTLAAENGCRFCWTIGEGDSRFNHGMEECPTIKIYNHNIHDYRRFRSCVLFEAYAVCWGCWMPQALCQDRGPKHCLYYIDLTAPIVFMAFIVPDLCSRVSQRFGLDMEIEIEEWMQWLGRKIGKKYKGIEAANATMVVEWLVAEKLIAVDNEVGI